MGGRWGWGWQRAPRRGASPPNRAERVGTGPEPARPARGGHRLSAAASGGGGGGGGPGGGPRGVPVGRSRGCAARWAAGPHACPRGGSGEREGRRGGRTPPKTISSLPSPRSRVGHTTGGSRGASPTSARVPLPRGPLRSHGVGPSPTPPPPHSPNQVAPTPHIHARPPPPPTPRSVHSVPFVPRSHGAPHPTFGDSSRGGHARPWGPTDTDPRTQLMPHPHASPRPSLAVPPTHLDTRGGTRAAVGTHAQSHAGRTHAHRCAALQVHNRPSHVRTRACPSPTRLLRSHACPTLPLPPLSRCRYRSRFLLTGEEEEEEEAEGGRPGPRPAWSHADTGGLRALLVFRSAPYGPNRAPAGRGGGGGSGAVRRC